MKVRFIKNEEIVVIGGVRAKLVTNGLTLNKVYEVEGEIELMYFIKDDNNVNTWHNKSKFEIVEDNNAKLNINQVFKCKEGTRFKMRTAKDALEEDLI